MLADESAGADTSVDTAPYLAHAVAAIHESHWVPVASAEAQPTWRAARERLERGADLTAADLHRAREILGWAASLKPRRADSYRARVAACLAHERLTDDQLPLAASAVRAFNLHLYYEIRGRKSRISRAQTAQPDRSSDPCGAGGASRVGR